jgi:hypothetical protein
MAQHALVVLAILVPCVLVFTCAVVGLLFVVRRRQETTGSSAKSALPFGGGLHQNGGGGGKSPSGAVSRAIAAARAANGHPPVNFIAPGQKGKKQGKKLKASSKLAMNLRGGKVTIDR